MTDSFHSIHARGITLVMDLAVGHIRSLEIERNGRTLAPLHTAPWITDGEGFEDPKIAANVRHLSGDFLCAPFGASDIPETPSHGWPANSAWSVVEATPFEGGFKALYRLDRKVMGAEVFKEIVLRDGHPFVYQRHEFRGGDGSLTVANHAMLQLPGAARIGFSPRISFETPARPLEIDPPRGRSALAYPTEQTSPEAFPKADGSTIDLTFYPIDQAHEDFLMSVHKTDATLGWTSVEDLERRFLFLSLKNPSVLPVTMFWYSNGGRHYAPWNGRHIGVLGIEEGLCLGAAGYRAAVEANRLTDRGIPTSLQLTANGVAEIRHVIGAIPLDGELGTIKTLAPVDKTLRVELQAGGVTSIPFDTDFLGGNSSWRL